LLIKVSGGCFCNRHCVFIKAALAVPFQGTAWRRLQKAELSSAFTPMRDFASVTANCVHNLRSNRRLHAGIGDAGNVTFRKKIKKAAQNEPLNTSIIPQNNTESQRLWRNKNQFLPIA
jgi:hypothetical protein